MPEDKRVSEGINRIPDVVMIEEVQATGRDGVFSLGMYASKRPVRRTVWSYT